MTFHFTLNSSREIYKIEKNQTILQAALKQGLVLPYGCKNGACASCKATLVKGDVDYGHYQAKALTEEEKINKKLLLCTAKPLSNVEIQANLISKPGMVSPKKLPCRVESIEKKAEDIAIVKLKLPASEKFNYYAGQYVDILLKDGKRRSYSMANPSNLQNLLELHIRHSPGGAFTDAIFESGTSSINSVKVKDILRLEGPLGTFFLREDSSKPIIFLASGTGFAPIKAVAEYAFSKNIQREMFLFWGVRKPSELYMHDSVTEWTRQFSNFKYIPVVSDNVEKKQWSGKTGFVHHAVIDEFPDLQNYSVYSCGSPIMVRSAQKDFVENCNLPEREFYSDAFTTAADLAENKEKK
ncbi:MAG: CDP-6-deoxy-delta-3,4-glucoseen reductase [Betaproteobacteria bacterium TMED156]|nr:MAG: CDP-6-deoxy-delta-3,4-glucoseen reductase [Betaproteobacteria bacterium TMED156]